MGSGVFQIQSQLHLHGAILEARGLLRFCCHIPPFVRRSPKFGNLDSSFRACGLTEVCSHVHNVSKS